MLECFLVAYKGDSCRYIHYGKDMRSSIERAIADGYLLGHTYQFVTHKLKMTHHSTPIFVGDKDIVSYPPGEYNCLKVQFVDFTPG